MNYRLRKIIYILLTFVLLLSSLPITVFAEETEHIIKWPTPPEITSGGAVVIEASTGAILYDKNAYEGAYLNRSGDCSCRWCVSSAHGRIEAR